MTSTLPPIQPHTKAKHEILRYHLEEWFPILGSVYRSLLCIDGFAGPGGYAGGEPGSPIVALDAIRHHPALNGFASLGKTVEFLFVDNEAGHCRHLKERIRGTHWPNAFKIGVVHAEFEDVLTGLLDDVVAGRRQMPPTLVFIDPFGPSGFPMDLLRRLASFDRVDLLINLNHLDFVRWILPDPTKHITADRLYGGPRWRPALALPTKELPAFLVTEYEIALREIGWRGTSFEMVNNQNQTAYHLVFGTGHPKGMEAIKRAMRSASPTGEFRYTDRIDPAQPVLLGMEMENEFPPLIGEHLFQKYAGREVAFDTLLEEEINWHRWWLATDLRAALRYLEYGDDPRIVSVRNRDGSSRRRNSHRGDSLITFGRPSQPRLL